ncbi:OLC1v1005856C1 [Oldenlandia corymbosa var. corymbosa]|uniref:OLC1v1005856C1 n=1 Tax=Oldenlandia corymbosa var. corymbosa TaxID=529605 RepID=A0AAV1DG95_OLDCO|nr:OLC1v1005856C1 [Oldenlandia corymbosa var. corymbosa]
MDFGSARKRGRPEGVAVNGNGGVKKLKQETESFSTGIGSKSKPCTKFFSTSGCQFGESCHFLHYVPGGIKAVTQILGSNPAIPAAPPRNQIAAPSFPDASSPPAVKTRLCNRINTAEGCKFGDKCHFAHNEWELTRSAVPGPENHHGAGPFPGRYGPRLDATPPGVGPAVGFGASATAKISVDASLAGAIIGKSGVNSKHICRMSGVKLAIRENESDPKFKNIELEGSMDQIKQATDMVNELIMNLRSAARPQMRNHGGTRGPPASNNFKTKLCENFTKGSCTFGDRCHFAHGEEELRSSGM